MSNNLHNWMSHNYDILKDKFINEIILPGTHNSGAYKVNLDIPITGANEIMRLLGKFFYPFKKYIESLTLNHELSVYEQCKIGCRIFDIRIFYDKKNNIWYNSHTFITVKLDDIINDLIKFIKENKREYIIILYKYDYPHRKQGFDFNKFFRYINSHEYCMHLHNYKTLQLSYENFLDRIDERIIWVPQIKRYGKYVKNIWHKTFDKDKLLKSINDTMDDNSIKYERNFIRKYIRKKDYDMIKKHFGKHTFSNSHNQDFRSVRRDYDKDVIFNYIGLPLYYKVKNDCKDENKLPITSHKECEIAGRTLDGISDRYDMGTSSIYPPGCYTDGWRWWVGTKNITHYPLLNHLPGWSDDRNICKVKRITSGFGEYIKNKVLNNIENTEMLYGNACTLTVNPLHLYTLIMSLIILSLTIYVFLIIYYPKPTMIKINKNTIYIKSIYALILLCVIFFVINKSINLKKRNNDFHKSFLKIKLKKSIGFYLFDYPTKDLSLKIINLNLK